MKIVVTGGAGFIGCNFVRLLAKARPDFEITVIDKMTYAGGEDNLADVLDKITLLKGDISNPSDVERAVSGCDAIVNFAAESHVDRSIEDAMPFIQSNILGTYVLLEAARKTGSKFVHISTDEVYGSIERGYFTETSMLNPRNPYSATKAAAEHLVNAYHHTHGLHTIITRSSNNFGPFQHPEKLIPKLIINAMQDKSLPIYGKGENVRDWIFVEDNCAGIMAALEKGKPGEVYNIGGGNEKSNIEIALTILRLLGKPESLIAFVKDRLGHDFRYAMSSEKAAKELGWKPAHNFEDGLRKTIEWYKASCEWWKKRM